jgi:hypothetical protein
VADVARAVDGHERWRASAAGRVAGALDAMCARAREIAAGG